MAFHFDFVDLQLFVNIAETQSLTKGAERSCISAPAASVRMKKLEDALGIQLFYRSAHGLSLTSTAQIFLKHARLMLRQADQLTRELPTGAQEAGCIRLYANTLSINDFIPNALQQFMHTYPHVNIDLHERSSVDIARAVKDGEADIGILSSEVPMQELRLLDYRAERLVVISCRQHPLTSQEQIEFRDTLQHDYVGLKENIALQAFMTRITAQLGVAPKYRVQVSTFDVLCNLVESGIGIALVPESVARHHAKSQGLAVLPLVDNWALRPLKIATQKDRPLSGIELALIDVLIGGAVSNTLND